MASTKIKQGERQEERDQWAMNFVSIDRKTLNFSNRNQTVDNIETKWPIQHEILTRLPSECGFFVDMDQLDANAVLKIGIFIPQDHRVCPESWKAVVDPSVLRGTIWYWNLTDVRKREICMKASPTTLRLNYGKRGDIHSGSSVGAYKDWNGSLHFVVDNIDLGIAVEKIPRTFFYGWLRFGSNGGNIKITHRMDVAIAYYYHNALSGPLAIKESKEQKKHKENNKNKNSAAPKKEEKEVSSLPAQKENGLYVYRMTKKPRGHCLIISNSKFHDFSRDRAGADVDEKALKSLFTELHFTVTIKRDLTAKGMNDALCAHSLINHDNFDAFVCVIMTHGEDDNVLLGVDESKTKLEDLMSQVKPTNCPSLRAKPKFFIVQACRGLFREDVAKSYCPNSFGRTNSLLRERAMFDTDGLSHHLCTDSTLPRSICPIEGDFVLACATTPGYVALRDSKQGSIFVQILVDVFRELHCGCHVVELLTEVNRRVAERVEDLTDGTYWQIPGPSFTLRGAFYL